MPSLLPHPKLNCGVTLAGDAWSRIVASGMFPPVVQAVMVQSAVEPRLALDAELVMPTQRLTFGSGAAVVPV